mmetsp:Transcript_24250/g.33207  ORF Transcript_24250/g.33207 Transcript_24250/m.33207 type:complete len:217 (+) Transcript_24250:803-1453(+)
MPQARDLSHSLNAMPMAKPSTILWAKSPKMIARTVDIDWFCLSSTSVWSVEISRALEFSPFSLSSPSPTKVGATLPVSVKPQNFAKLPGWNTKPTRGVRKPPRTDAPQRQAAAPSFLHSEAMRWLASIRMRNTAQPMSAPDEKPNNAHCPMDDLTPDRNRHAIIATPLNVARFTSKHARNTKPHSLSSSSSSCSSSSWSSGSSCSGSISSPSVPSR